MDEKSDSKIIDQFIASLYDNGKGETTIKRGFQYSGKSHQFIS